MNKEFKAYNNHTDAVIFFTLGDAMSWDKGEGLYSDQWDIVQWTGLYDRNRVKVFEGDIVIHHLLQGEKYTAFFDERKAKFSLKDKDTCWGVDSLEASKYCEVIGNEFQHSELLKEAK